jgi:2',3'-cyclic-nucleotide 2'-phosphodiesterase (5'-nucleotidase family)
MALWTNVVISGCHTTPYGGIDREYNAVQELRKDQPGRLLYIDSGNSLAPQEFRVSLKQNQNKAEVILTALNQSGLDLYSIGSNDLKLGVEFLKGKSKTVPFEMIATNVLDKNKQPFFTPYTVKHKLGVNIVFFNILSALPQGVENVTLQPYEDTLREWLPKLKKLGDVVVLVADLPIVEIEKLAQKNPGLDLIVSNDASLSIDEPYVYNNGKTIVVNNGRYGYYLGKLKWDLNLPNAGSYSPKAVEKHKAELALYESQLAKNPNNEKAKTYINFLKNSVQYEVIENGSPFENELVALSAEKFGKKNSISALLSKEKENLKKKALSE